MKTMIWCTTEFQGWHRWKDAPDEVSYLASFHRHIFHVKLTLKVEHQNRAIEFISLKQKVNEFIAKKWANRYFEESCEQIAACLLTNFGAYQVEVSEDGENGAIVQQTITDIKRTKCFVGTEAEGPHRGSFMLFAPGSCTEDRLKTIFDRVQSLYLPLKGIYYGAGNEPASNATLESFIKVLCKQHNLICTIDYGNLVRVQDTEYTKQVKDGWIIWMDSKCHEYKTLENDPLFDLDQFVE